MVRLKRMKAHAIECLRKHKKKPAIARGFFVSAVKEDA